jgi:hypothetical protein
LYSKFDREVTKGGTKYKWKSTGIIAFEEVEDVIKTEHGINTTIVKAMVQRAKELGWKSVVVNGSKTFQQLVQKHAKELGVPVQGKHIIPEAVPVQRVRSTDLNTEPITKTLPANKEVAPSSHWSSDKPLEKKAEDNAQATTEEPKSTQAREVDRWEGFSGKDQEKIIKIAENKFDGDHEKAIDWYVQRITAKTAIDIEWDDEFKI